MVCINMARTHSRTYKLLMLTHAKTQTPRQSSCAQMQFIILSQSAPQSLSAATLSHPQPSALLSISGRIPSLLIASTFPSLASFPCVLVPPTVDARRDARKPSEERGNEEICFKRHETSSPLKCHAKRRPFLMTATADHSWISCQSALTAVETISTRRMHLYYLLIISICIFW